MRRADRRHSVSSTYRAETVHPRKDPVWEGVPLPKILALLWGCETEAHSGGNSFGGVRLGAASRKPPVGC